MNQDKNKTETSPSAWIEAWIPHILIFLLLISSVFLLNRVLAPVMPSLLMAAALASLTTPICYNPLLLLLKKILPNMENRLLRKVAAFAAIAAMGLCLLIPLVILIFSVTGSFVGAEKMLMSLVTKNILEFDKILSKILEQVQIYKELYPSIPIDPEWISTYLKSTFQDFFDFQATVMAFLFKGTGSFAAQMVLCFIAMIFFYAEGAIIVRTILKATALNDEKAEFLITTFRNVVLRLLTDTLAVSLFQGILLGFWVGLFTGFNTVVIIFFASFICLLPMVGSTIIWFPAFMLLLNRGDVSNALLLGALCLASLYATSWFKKNKVAKLHEYNPVTSFLLFMSIVGGIVSFGFKGLILGPMSVVLVYVLGSTWHSIYKK